MEEVVGGVGRHEDRVVVVCEPAVCVLKQARPPGHDDEPVLHELLRGLRVVGQKALDGR